MKFFLTKELFSSSLLDSKTFLVFTNSYFLYDLLSSLFLLPFSPRSKSLFWNKILGYIPYASTLPFLGLWYALLNYEELVRAFSFFSLVFEGVSMFNFLEFYFYELWFSLFFYYKSSPWLSLYELLLLSFNFYKELYCSS